MKATFKHKIVQKFEGNQIHTSTINWCNNFTLRDLFREKEVEQWEAEGGTSLLKAIERDTSCSLINVQESHEEVRLISGKNIFRPSWKRTISFSCQHDPSSQCVRLRKQGGLLVSQKCLEADGDHCLLWGKVYDMGSEAAQQSSLISFTDDALLYLEDTDTSYPANREFGRVMATLAAIANVSKQVNRSIDPNQVAIFVGKEAKCRRSFDSKNLFDCCYTHQEKGRGLCIKARLGKCNEEERDLYADTKAGKCHFLGNLEKFFMTRQVYCCFPTKLARIIHEEGRKQLGMGWGTPDKPACFGFSLEQIASLDFSNMDLSEYACELKGKIDEKQLARELTQAAKEVTSKTSLSDLKKNTENCLRSQNQIIKGGNDVSK